VISVKRGGKMGKNKNKFKAITKECFAEDYNVDELREGRAHKLKQLVFYCR
jgi:hypothetical protein